MYEHYERHRTDNITDPALRRAHPISTISGWDRDRDEPIENTAGNQTTAIASAQTNGGPVKISKSEQTDENDIVDLDNVKCVCEDITDEAEDGGDDDGTATKNIELHTPITNGSVATTVETTKPISSISSISQVYNEQLTGTSVVCNGNTHTTNSEDESMSSPRKETDNGNHTAGSDALRKSLEIDSYDANEDNKEIVEEIVEEILKNSENLLDDCKRSLDEDTETASSVIKDEEIEHAVSEVVKGVRQIEMMSKRDSENNATNLKNAESTATPTIDDDPMPQSISIIDDTRNDNQKTDLVLSSAIITNNNIILANDDDKQTTPITDPSNDVAESEDIEQIVTNIVNDVIENCVNQTLNDNAEKCNNDHSKTLTTQNDIVDNINNNNTDVNTNNEINDNNNPNNTNDNNDNAIISNTNIVQEQAAEVVNTVLNEAVNATTVQTKETNEEFVTNIVNEIVDNCINLELPNNGDKNNNSQAHQISEIIKTEESLAQSAQSATAPTAESIQTPKIAVDEKLTTASKHLSDDEHSDNRPIKLSRSHSTSISTSTQVENNHFGKNFCFFHFYVEYFIHFFFLLLFQSQIKDNNDQNLVQHDQCLVQVHHDHHSVFQNLSGHTFINAYYPMFCSH